MQESNNPILLDERTQDDITALILFFMRMDLERPQEEDRAERFLNELNNAYEEIRRFPESHAFIEEPMRRFILVRSKCVVLFVALEQVTLVLLIGHEREDRESLLAHGMERFGGQSL